MSDTNTVGEYPGVERESLEELNRELEKAGFFDREVKKLEARITEEVEALKRTYAARMEELRGGLADASQKATNIYVNEVYGKAVDKTDIITLPLPAGKVELRTNPEKFVVTDAEQLRKWAKARGLLRLVTEVKRSITATKVKELLKARPALRTTLKGAHFERERTLTLKPAKVDVALVQKVDPLKVTP